MHDSGGRTSLGRGVAVVMVVLLGAAVVSPAFSAFNPTKKKVKKIARKQATKQIKALVPGLVDSTGSPLFVEEDELIRFGGTANIGDPEKDLVTVGPSSFTVSLICTDSGGGIPTLRVEIRTTEDNSIVSGELGENNDFDSGNQNQGIFEDTATTANDPEVFDEEADFWAASPSGLSVRGSINVAANFGGGDCYASGDAFRIAPA